VEWRTENKELKLKPKDKLAFEDVEGECPFDQDISYLFLNATNTTHDDGAKTNVEYDKGAGFVTVTYYYSTTVGVELQLGRFPFDRQLLHLRLQHRNDEVSTNACFLPLKMDGYGSWCSLLGALSSEWVLRKPFLRAIEDKDANNVHYFIPVERKPSYFVTKIAVPIFFIVLSLSPAWAVDAAEFGTRLSVASTMLLTAVAFQYIVSAFLPKTGYMTLMDKYVLAAFVYQFLELATMTVTYILISSVPSDSSIDGAGSLMTAETIRFADRCSAVAFVGVWVLFHLVLVLARPWYRASWDRVFADWMHRHKEKEAGFYQYALNELPTVSTHEFDRREYSFASAKVRPLHSAARSVDVGFSSHH
jgi:hypothetical protein